MRANLITANMCIQTHHIYSTVNFYYVMKLLNKEVMLIIQKRFSLFPLSSFCAWLRTTIMSLANLCFVKLNLMHQNSILYKPHFDETPVT